MNISEKIHKHLSEQLLLLPAASRWVLAYSGGLDSSVLLHALVVVYQQLFAPLAEEAGKTQDPYWALRDKLKILHIHHGLNKDADSWVLHCQQQAAHYHLECRIIYVDAQRQATYGPEASARVARYRAFAAELQQQDVLLLAHQANDQVETFFLRLARGAGIKGLTAIPQQRKLAAAKLLRPLLNITRSELQHYAEQYALHWVEDSSNRDENFDRNFIRQRVVPMLAQRWPQFVGSVQQSISWLQEQHVLAHEIAHVDLQSCLHRQDDWGGESIDYVQFKKLSAVRAKNLLRTWLTHFSNVSLSKTCLVELLRDDFKYIEIKCASNVLAVEHFGDALHCYYLPTADWSTQAAQQTLTLQPERVLCIPNVGYLQLHTRVAEYQQLTVRFRRGGERSHPQQRAHSQKLKKLLQEYRVPRWWRQRVPLLYAGEQLLAVGDLWLEKSTKPCCIRWEKFSKPTPNDIQ